MVMINEPLRRKINECQDQFIAVTSVREQSTNHIVHSMFLRSSSNFKESNVTLDTTTTYTILKCSLRCNQQYQNMRLVSKHFC